MNKLIVTITLIPWLLNYVYESKNNLIKLKENHYLISNFNIKKILNIKSLLLFLVFIIISTIYKESNQIELSNSLLFSSINIFLFIYNYYENDDYELELNIKEKTSIITHIIISSIAIVLSLSREEVSQTYNILFATNILNIIILYISNKIITIVRRINNEIKQL
jgi:hypothetical protein